MDQDTSVRVLTLGVLLGLIGTVVGGFECIKGHTYSVAAQHEATTIGHVVKVTHGKGGPDYRYVFSANGVKVDDDSEVCSTPLTSDACWNNGPVLVYYSYTPYANSRLEEFSVASSHAYRIGEPALTIGLALLALVCVSMVISSRWDKTRNNWPTIDAVVDVVSVADVTDDARFPRYRATLTYVYRNPEEQMGDCSRDFGKEEDAQAWANSFKGESVKVHVDPRDPTSSVLREEDL